MTVRDVTGVFAGLLDHPFVLFDGAVGTELATRGVDMRAPIASSDEHDDYWTGKALLTAPDIVARVHEEYVAAGADVVTTNTFRLHRHVLAEAGHGGQLAALVDTAVGLARRARGRSSAVRIAGSVGPVGICYAADAGGTAATLRQAHAAIVAALGNAGVDLVLFETMNTTREAVIAAEEARARALPFVTSFTLAETGRLPSGESLRAAVTAVVPLAPLAILVNCCDPRLVEDALRCLTAAVGAEVWCGAQAHLAKATPENGWPFPGNCSVDEYARYARRWAGAGARIIGGCCGTSPAYIRALARARRQWAAPALHAHHT